MPDLSRAPLCRTAARRRVKHFILPMHGALQTRAARIHLPLQLLRKQQAEGARPGSSSAAAAAQQHRFLVTKLSWRGSYRRLLCITPTHILTLYPDTLAVTNSWAYAGDHDLAGVEVGGEHGAEGGVFTLHFRRDKKVSGQAEMKGG